MDVKKVDFRNDLIKSSSVNFEKIEIAKEDLYKNKNGLVWHEQNKEISLLGKFYEVIKIEEHNGKQVLYVLDDKKENELLASFFASQNNKSEPLLKFVKLLLNLQFERNLNLNFEIYQPVTDNYNKYISLNYQYKHSFKIIKPPCF